MLPTDHNAYYAPRFPIVCQILIPTKPKRNDIWLPYTYTNAVAMPISKPTSRLPGDRYNVISDLVTFGKISCISVPFDITRQATMAGFLLPEKLT